MVVAAVVVVVVVVVGGGKVTGYGIVVVSLMRKLASLLSWYERISEVRRRPLSCRIH